jgi:CheY-like chemotaxis protein/predicted Zn-ribbon and HTH transcriptional regulator
MKFPSRKRRTATTANDAATDEELETVRRVLARYDPGSRVEFGAPTRCPECGTYGFIESINRAEGTTHNHCFTCRTDWVISLRALKEARRPALTGDGLLFQPAAATVRGVDGPLTLLVVEDDPLDAALVKSIIQAAERPDVVVEHAPSLAEGKARMRTRPVDVVLLDLGLPDSSGLDTLQEWMRVTGSHPVIVVTGDANPRLPTEARRRGAANFMQKRRLLDLVDKGSTGGNDLVKMCQDAVAA